MSDKVLFLENEYGDTFTIENHQDGFDISCEDNEQNEVIVMLDKTDALLLYVYLKKQLRVVE